MSDRLSKPGIWRNFATMTLTTGLVPEWTLADRIRKARELKGWEQGELADALYRNRSSVSNWERGANHPTDRVIRAIAELTGVDENWLRGDDGGGESPSGHPRDDLKPARDLARLESEHLQRGNPSAADILALCKPIPGLAARVESPEIVRVPSTGGF